MKTILRSKKIVIIAIIVTTLAFGIWKVFKKNHHAAPMTQDPVIVEVKKIKKGNIEIEAQAAGTLVAAQNVTVTPEVAGVVEKILVEDGAFVKRGTPLIQLDSTVNKAKAESAKANFTYSSSNHNRMLWLGKKGAISQQAIDQALADMKEKKALAEEARVQVEKMVLTAPFDGKLGKIKVNKGEHVNIGQAIVSLTDTQHLRVEYSISEKYFAYIKLGQLVSLTTTTYPGKEFHGKVAYISPTINTEDRTVSVYADVPNDAGLLTAGLFVNVKHILGMENNVLLIPAVSLVATIDGQQVFKVVNDKAVAVLIKIGQRTMEQVQVIHGLSIDDTVVISGQHKIKDGSPVKFKS